VISVIVRVRDEAAALERCLSLVCGQTVAAQLVVVDNASSDASAAVARRFGATVVTIGAAEFSFGAALNRGAQAAGGELLVALSAHAFPGDERWLERVAEAMSDRTLACACGERFRPDGTPLREPFRYDGAAAERWPSWGYSNAAGVFRAELWRERRFDEGLPGCEDKEWGRHWALRGRPTLLDPGLVVEHDHTHDPVAQIYRRARREAAGYRAFLGDRAPGPGSMAALAAQWWTDMRFYASPWRARLSHRRTARLLGEYAGARRR
jgi:rhamnosyltransferase